MRRIRSAGVSPDAPVGRGPRTGILILLVFAAALGAGVSDAAAQRGAQAEIADWRMLAGLDYNTGQMSDALRSVNGKRVRVPGYMVPLDDSARGVTEFILVPYYGACIHTPPPPPNQMVYVKMTGNRRVEVNLWEPIWIEGELNVSEIDSPYGAIGHQLAGVTLSPYRW
jgi:uncharacterized protein